MGTLTLKTANQDKITEIAALNQKLIDQKNECDEVLEQKETKKIVEMAELQRKISTQAAETAHAQQTRTLCRICSKIFPSKVHLVNHLDHLR